MGLSALAAAQSSVTISGQVRLAVTRGNGGGSALYGAGGQKAWSVNDVLSLVNVMGNEDLGGGTKAGFHLQHFLQADTGTLSSFSDRPNTFWDGRSVAYVGGGFGEVYAGRDYAPIAFTGFGADPWGWDGSASQVGIIQWANYLSTSGIRTSNTVGYKTPSLGGFTAQVAVSAGEGSVQGKDTGANLTYANGPVWASLSYDGHRNANGTDNDNLVMGAAAYDLGAVRPAVLFASSKVAGRSYNSSSFSLTAPVGSGVAKAAVSRISDWTPATASRDALVKVAAGYQYNLSKRTHIFGSAATAKGQGASRTTALELGLGHSF